MKKLITLMLLLVGFVGQSKAWNTIYLHSKADWGGNSKQFHKVDDNTFFYIVPANSTYCYDDETSGVYDVFYFRFYLADSGNEFDYRPLVDKTIVTTDGIFPGKQTSADGNSSFMVKSNGTAKSYKIILNYLETSTDVWEWKVSVQYSEPYNITYIDEAKWKWSNVYFYVHQDGYFTDEGWPGKVITGSDTEDEDIKCFSATVDGFEGSKIIFNDNGVNQHEKDLVNNGVYRSHVSSINLYAINANISSEGYATFSSTKSVNFTGVAGLTAKKGKVKSNGFIEWTTAENLYAGEGVLLSGNPGTYTLNIVDNAEADVNNEFKAIDTKQKLSQSGGGGKTNYILAHPAGNTLGFYKVNTAGSWCKAGTAYISSSNGPAAAREFIPLWEEDPTGVDEVLKTENLENGTYYNLAGQQIAKPSRGLYIVNGKKVIR